MIAPSIVGPVKRRGADQKIGSRFALCGFIEKSDICSHGPAYTKDAVTGRIDPHIFQKDLTVGNKKTCCDRIKGLRSRYLPEPGSHVRKEMWSGLMDAVVPSAVTLAPK